MNLNSVKTSIKNMNSLTLACKLSPVRKSMKPFIIHEAGVSPGWTRAVTTIAFFFCVINNKEKIMTAAIYRFTNK
jgi:hypothetical protein